MPDPIYVPEGTVITLSASGSVGSGYANYKIGSAAQQSISVSPIASGTQDFGYVYNYYS